MMPQQYFKNADEITKPENLNKVIKENYDYTDKQVEGIKGKFKKTANVVGVNSIPEDMEDGDFKVEFNDSNKRILFNIKGKLWKSDLTEVT